MSHIITSTFWWLKLLGNKMHHLFMLPQLLGIIPAICTYPCSQNSGNCWSWSWSQCVGQDIVQQNFYHVFLISTRNAPGSCCVRAEAKVMGGTALGAGLKEYCTNCMSDASLLQGVRVKAAAGTQLRHTPNNINVNAKFLTLNCRQ